jgi:phosphoenolpyruvate carboxykinase (ATP)
MSIEKGLKASSQSIADFGIKDATVHWNLKSETLADISVEKEMGIFSNTGALAIDTGKFTGRSPKDRFIVKDSITEESVWWGDINLPFEADKFDKLYGKVVDYLSNKEIYARNAVACAGDTHRLPLTVVNEYPWSNMFADNMFIRPTETEIQNFDSEWTVINAPGFMANPEVDGTRQHNFAVLSFTKKVILIGGTGYTGEIKKGIFSALNFILPFQKDVLSMHCSANVGNEGDTALFFGLSGTGKTTLSADPNRNLIGDDEHGWSNEEIFNFEGGCYAKCIDLSEEKEPDIFKAIKGGALLENITFKEGTNEPDYDSGAKTENTRVSYPIHHINNIQVPSTGPMPKNIFFLTCDAFGVLPPISKLTPGQAMFHFISGYTAKVAGTEAGITEPQTTFSACFGAPFMPLHPTFYAEMLGKKMATNDVNVWLVNTGWSGGGYGVGSRMKLKYTRSMITAALNGELNDVEYKDHAVFGLSMPASCPNVPDELLFPKNTWDNKEAYDTKANELANAFNANFVQFADNASDEILAAAPKAVVNA